MPISIFHNVNNKCDTILFASQKDDCLRIYTVLSPLNVPLNSQLKDYKRYFLKSKYINRSMIFLSFLMNLLFETSCHNIVITHQNPMLS